MKVTETDIPGVLLFEPTVFQDERGGFFETYRADELHRYGIPNFVQDNQARSVPRTLRGLHYQLQRPQGKLIRALAGMIFDVAVDIRRGSPTFGKSVGTLLSGENRKQIYIPPGFAHGYCVVGDEPAEALYKCTDIYSGPADQCGVAWNDPGLGIAWPVTDPILSEKDRQYQRLTPGRLDLPE